MPEDALVLLFVGRIQPLKAPDVLLHAAAELLADDPALRSRLRVHVVGAPSGSGLDAPEQLQKLAGDLGIADVVTFFPPQPPERLADHYRAADVAVVPSHNESFGLVALEAQACGTPVVAAAVGGLRTAVRDGVSGVLVDGHDPRDYAAAVRAVLARRELLSAGARRHAALFSWDRTADEPRRRLRRRPPRTWPAPSGRPGRAPSARCAPCPVSRSRDERAGRRAPGRGHRAGPAGRRPRARAPRHRAAGWSTCPARRSSRPSAG